MPVAPIPTTPNVMPSTVTPMVSEEMRRIKQQFERDERASRKWRRKAKSWYAMRDGDQWDETVKNALAKEQRPAITFGRVRPVLNVVCGLEISNRQEVAVFPRQPGDAIVSDLATEGLKWLDDRCQADTEESRAFLDMLTCGLGVTETRIDYMEDPKGKTIRERVNPRSMFWDARAVKRNLTDARRTWRVKIIERDEAQEMFPDANPMELDADWANIAVDEAAVEVQDSIRDYRKDNHTAHQDLTQPVRLVQLQYWERRHRHVVTGPEGVIEVDEEDVKLYRGLSDYEIERAPYRHYRYAILGKTILQEGDLDPEGQFHFQFMTGDYNENEKHWQGLVELMVGPQQSQNKTISNIIHLLSTMRKGGFLYEAGFFVDEEKAKRELAKPNPAIAVNHGSLSNPNGGQKFAELSTGQLPQGIADLLTFEKESIYECAGVPFELLSQQPSDQLSGIQEYERKRAGITMLAGYFDSLRLYRIQQAALSFDFLRAFHEGALIRLLQEGEEGEEVEQYVPLILDDETEEYDFVIDDSPTAPNQQERTWQLLVPLIPAFIQVGAPPEMLHEILRASPLPRRVVERIIGTADEENPQEQQQQELQMRTIVAQLAKLESEAQENQAQALKAQAGAQLDQAKAADLGYRQKLDTLNELSEIDMARDVAAENKKIIDHQ